MTMSQLQRPEQRSIRRTARSRNIFHGLLASETSYNESFEAAGGRELPYAQARTCGLFLARGPRGGAARRRSRKSRENFAPDRRDHRLRRRLCSVEVGHTGTRRTDALASLRCGAQAREIRRPDAHDNAFHTSLGRFRTFELWSDGQSEDRETLHVPNRRLRSHTLRSRYGPARNAIRSARALESRLSSDRRATPYVRSST